MSSNSFKVKNSLVLTPKDLTTLVSPEAGDIACDINDNNKIKKYDAITSSWSEVGSGAASLDNIFQLIGDDVSSWSKGNNATFLGGGSLAGTFATESAAPLNGLQSYKYTQAAGSLNDYIASPVKSVPARFKGQTCILSFPFNYNGSTNDIEVVLYDVTNSAIIPNSMFITSSSTTSVLTSYITIPTTCSSIRVGFKVAVANSGKILNFDDVQLSQTSLYTPQPESQSSTLELTQNITNATITGVLQSQNGSGIYSYNSSTGVYTVLKAAQFVLNLSLQAAAAATALGEIRIDGDIVQLSNTQNSTGYWASVSWSGKLQVGQTIAFLNNSSSTSSAQKISVLATANSNQILTAPETFSTDTAALTYANAATYTLSTLANAPVGTYITFTYAINTNTRTQTTTRPTQTDADMNSNGIQIFTRAYNAASTAGNPAAIAIQIGKGLKGKSLDLYKSAGKVTAGSLDRILYSVNTIEDGVSFKEYNENTGILYIDAGYKSATAVTSASFLFSDISTQTSGYLVINASKNPALTAVSTTRTGTLLRITTFTSSGTWTLPNDVGSIVVEVQGGGGAGGSGNSSAGAGGSGGGAGGYSQKLISRSSLGATETVTVGAASGASSFGSHCSATGGSTGAAQGLAGGAGGIGSNGDINLRGQGGAPGSNALASGSGGTSPRFGGGAPADGSGVGTAAQANSGSGGSGGYSGAGGAGATGVVVVYEYSV